MKNKRTPDIRFPGFTGDWEQCNLGNISTKIGSGKTPKGGNQNYKSEGIPLLRSQNIFNDKVNFNDVVHITPEIDEDMANSRVQKDDVLLNITGASIGRSAVYKLNHKANVNQHVSIIRPSSEVNPYFIQLNITSEKGQKQIELNQAGGGREGLNFQQIAKMVFYFPALVEQGKIGEFFIQLDNTIALYQHELNILKQTKQGFLQKMFPKEGESVPEIRFPGFTGDWEQHKVMDFSEETFGGGTPKTSIKEYWNGEIPWIQSSDLDEHQVSGVFAKKKITEKGLQNSATKLIPKNSIAIVTRVGVGKIALMQFEYATSQDFLSLSNLKVNEWFGVYSLYNQLQKELNNVQGTSIKGITKSELLDKKINIPTNLEEQNKIGEFFKQLDDTIALHQCELVALKETKKAFLQKMFV
ncbi:restriction endonuclease subunit S [Bacillus wiedmannii]|uniref:restriction endonuclease subunit S n=1 Tax=Bacillus wiedmannii TaxID=1890302 RepID=UPI0006D97245|nr:restriction endonuclease subunit S [Bacillus wiedmannii]MCU5445261.1 restriction endonuclease subunit S [Bacillus cereus]KPU54995.1 type I restriction modification DNA specificity domain protein [Bacillus wiedmannii]PEP91471.1 restriction endonuclease subunit S [Bacillus wiedmannii]PHB04650.1 restriction endonuclease subunit S [Bacillus wiedmannii]TKI12799.1 restriction endonuclease subunit S [Bacillus wiedmannii]